MMTTIYTHHHHHQQPDSDAAQEVCKSPSSAAAAMAAASMRSERVRVQWSVSTLSLLPLKAVKVMTGICKTLTDKVTRDFHGDGRAFLFRLWERGSKFGARLLDYQNGSTLNMINILRCRLMTCTFFRSFSWRETDSCFVLRSRICDEKLEEDLGEHF